MNDSQHTKQSETRIKKIDFKPFIEPELDARYYLQLPPDKLIITMIGSLVKDQGHCFFLELAKSVEKRFENVHFLIVHEDIDPEFQEEFIDLVVNSNLKHKLDTVQSDRKIPDVLKSTDIFVEPAARGKGFAENILKAMATGLPVISVKTELLQNVILQDQTGFLIENNDLSTAVEMISVLIADVEMSKKMGKLGKERALEYFGA
ncbi:glycosyltransferase [Belliella sp. DSM 107340]|uniref:Glycosyltransferase n=1 Tax=Belliella calami TaxID=2923436 RepID=A0ABS9UM97_9BACT|nr:glycosyltransferase [Belliella calami]MCH7397731.1 glycosyltransferase [Belliella calami]